ncbi:hypothetical protein [Serratia marcescens]|uniref:hypothetical protein n=1 Tax=Serratia marcescens TaxID=615 RepID=UPI00148BDF8D|nr:hypothetical protein [Serratia marcescens]QJU42305.1 hypothetical protein HMI62_24675 [Serratia marcescens]
MQNEILDGPPLRLIEGVLITQAERFKRKRAQNILQFAQRRAKNLIAQAQRDAELLHQDAYRQGYEQGVLSAADALTCYMQDSQTFTLALHRQLYEKARIALAAALGNEIVFTSLLRNWLPDLDSQDNCDLPLEILVPSALGIRVGKLKRDVEQWYERAVLVSYHPDNRYAVKCGDQLAEFIPEEFVEQLLPSLIDLKTLRQQCSELSDNGVEKLHNQFMQHFERAHQAL